MDQHPMTVAILAWILLALPALFYSFGRLAWRGLRGQEVTTNLGKSAGWLGRVYGIIYLAILIGLVALLPVLFGFFRALDFGKITRSLGFILVHPILGITLVIFGLAFIPFIFIVRARQTETGIDSGEELKNKKVRRIFQYSIPSLFILIGLPIAVGTTIVIPLAILLIWSYFGALVGDPQFVSR